MTTPTPPGGKNKNKKILGLSPTTLVVVLGIAVIGGAVILLKRRSSSSSSSSSGTAGSTSGVTAAAFGICPDGSTAECGGTCPDGSQPDCTSGDATSTLQTELEDLQSSTTQAEATETAATQAAQSTATKAQSTANTAEKQVKESTVPNVVGRDAGESHNQIQAAGLLPVAPSSQKPTDITTATVPKAGTKLPAGSRVTIVAKPKITKTTKTAKKAPAHHTKKALRMLTRRRVTHQYGHHPDDYSPPPNHVYMHDHQYPEPTSRAVLYGQGGLMGGAVTLRMRGPSGSTAGNTGYGYLGMDPSDPTTWPRPFNPAPGMIGYLNWQSQ